VTSSYRRTDHAERPPRRRRPPVWPGAGPTGDEWDAFVAATPGGRHQQTTRWARLKEVEGWDATTVAVPGGTGLIGGAQLLVKRLPGLPAAGSLAYCAKGPVVAGGEPDVADRVLDAVVDRCRQLRVRLLVVQPPEGGPDLEPALGRRQFAPWPTAVAPDASVVVDLTGSMSAIEARWTAKHRSNMRRAERKGVAVRAGARADVERFHALLTAAAGRLGYDPYPLAYFQRLWDVYGPDDVRLLLAEHDGQLVSALLCLAYGDTAYRKNVAWSGHLAALAVNDLLDREAIRWAKERGLSRYDLEGIPYAVARRIAAGEDMTSLPLKGATAYKLKWGGTVQVFPRPMVFVPNRFARPILNTGLRSQRAKRALRSVRALVRTGHR
jgi:lipid II:glycine glycyltransferase (peptidoglycan interpeptide bridge formation enzyme)